MRRFLLLLFGTAWCLSPVQAEALTTTVWDVQNFAEQEWQASTNLQISLTPNGLRLQSSLGNATLYRAFEATHAIDAVRITYTSTATITAKAMWSTVKTGPNLYMAPFVLPKAEQARTYTIDYARYDAWNSKPTHIGLQLPANADVTLQNIELLHWNIFEKTAAAIQGVFVFDSAGPYSVNFLWGPRLALNPVQVAQAFVEKPPSTKSANWLAYIALALGGVYVWWRKKTVQTFFVLFGCVWLLYDLRMGSEFISYAYSDYTSYYSQEIGVRTFRDRSFFSDFAEAITPFVQNEEKYIFLPQNGAPYRGLLRYYTYPSLPVEHFDGNANLYKTWIVYKRPDVQLNAEGRLVLGQQVLSPPGKILHEFAAGSFIFQASL